MHTVHLKRVDMLCHRCVLNVVRGLSQIQKIRKLDVDLATKRVRIVYEDEKYSRKTIQKIVYKCINNGKMAETDLREAGK